MLGTAGGPTDTLGGKTNGRVMDDDNGVKISLCYQSITPAVFASEEHVFVEFRVKYLDVVHAQRISKVVMR